MTGGSTRRSQQLVFTDPFDQDGAEALSYTANGFVDVEGIQIHVETQLVRNPANPDEVTLEIWFPCDPPTAIRVSTYNASSTSRP